MAFAHAWKTNKLFNYIRLVEKYAFFLAQLIFGHFYENNATEMSQESLDITRFEHFTDQNLFEYASNVIQNWEMDALQFFIL